MYKHKPGIQMDVKGFNESVNITDKKIKNVRHIAYDVIETMLCEQEKKDKNLKFRLDGHQNLVLDDLEYPSYKMIFNYKHGKSNHVYELHRSFDDFEYERCNTKDKFTDWIQHLNGKNWVHKTMLSQFMRLADKIHKEKTGENLIGWGSL